MDRRLRRCSRLPLAMLERGCGRERQASGRDLAELHRPDATATAARSAPTTAPIETVEDLQLAVERAEVGGGRVHARPAQLREEMRMLCRRARVHYCDILGRPSRRSRTRMATKAARRPATSSPAPATSSQSSTTTASARASTTSSQILGYLGYKTANVFDRQGHRAAGAVQRRAQLPRPATTSSMRSSRPPARYAPPSVLELGNGHHRRPHTKLENGDPRHLCPDR